MTNPELKTPSRTSNRTTIGDVASKAGVSIATVSRVINGTAQVSPLVAERVQAVITDLKYQPHTAAKNLARGHTNTLGLVLPEISGDFFAPMLRGIETAINQAGYNLLISVHNESLRPLGQMPLGNHNTEGLLIFTNSLPDSSLQHLHSTGFPIVLLYQNSPGTLAIPSINIENKSGAHKLVDHLIDVHHYRRIAFLAGPSDNEDSHWRETGYRDSLAAHQIMFDPALVASGGFEEEEAKASVRQWLANGIQFEAVFAGDDESAVGAIIALRDSGKRVPQDVAVVGFDDIPLARHVTPALTTVRAPTERAGYESATQLIQLIRTGQTQIQTLLPTELIVRQSCGCR